MALSGYFYGTTDNPRVKPKISWAATQNTAENYSEITVTLTYSRVNKGYTTAGTWEGKITIGDQSFKGRKHISVTYQSDTAALTATAKVYHDEYGKLTVPITATGAIDGSSVTETAVSGQAQVDTIARASAVSAANAPIGSCATIVVARKNESFSHSLFYQFGGLEGYIDQEGNPVAEEQKMTAAAVNFLLPDSFYHVIPDQQAEVCQITCYTYSGDHCIGSQTCQFTATADPAMCAPRILDATIFDANADTVAVTGNDRILVRYASTACCQVAAEARQGAAIVALTVNGVPAQDGEVMFPGAEVETYVVEATDSRGYKVSLPVTMPMIPYVLLTCRADAQRTDPTADMALITLQGNCWKGNFGTAENELRITCTVAGGAPQILTPQVSENHTYTTQLTAFGVSYTQSYPVELTISDGVSTITEHLTIRKGVPVFDWGEQEFRFHVPVVLEQLFVGEQTLEEYIRAIVQEEAQ